MTDFERAHDASMPASASVRSVSGLMPFGSVPALWTSNRSPPFVRSSASAITLRAEFPVHTNSTRIGRVAHGFRSSTSPVTR